VNSSQQEKPMADAEITALRAKLASRPRSDDYRQRRRDFDARSLEYPFAPDVTVEPVTANGVRAEWTSTPGDSSDAALLYLHGGGYVIGSLDSHRHLVAEAGRAAGCWALALDYRLAPGPPFPPPGGGGGAGAPGPRAGRVRGRGVALSCAPRRQARPFGYCGRQRGRGAGGGGEGGDP